MSDGVFVTGGSGFLGRAVVRRLVDEGRRVVALCRSDAAHRALVDLGAETVVGDVRDQDSLGGALRGCPVVYHLAGVNALCLKDPSEMFAANVLGSKNVVEAAARNEVRRVVYTSSASTLGESSGTVGHEASAHRGWFLSSYERSKFEGERVARARARELDLDLVCLNPSSVQGPGRSGGTARILTAYLNGRLRVFVDTRISLVDIDDCTEGHVRAETLGAPGERYVLSGAALSTTEALELAARIAGVTHRPRVVPGWLALGAATAIEGFARVRNRVPPACREMVRTIQFGHDYDGSRAARELGVVYRPVEDTLRRAIAWQREQGLIPPA